MGISARSSAATAGAVRSAVSWSFITRCPMQQAARRPSTPSSSVVVRTISTKRNSTSGHPSAGDDPLARCLPPRRPDTSAAPLAVTAAPRRHRRHVRARRGEDSLPVAANSSALRRLSRRTSVRAARGIWLTSSAERRPRQVRSALQKVCQIRGFIRSSLGLFQRCSGRIVYCHLSPERCPSSADADASISLMSNLTIHPDTSESLSPLFVLYGLPNAASACSAAVG